MQVLNYQTPPIAKEGIQRQIIQQSIDSIQQHIKEPFQQIFNSTLSTINQTIKQVLSKGDAQKTLESISPTHDFEEDWNFLYFLRLFFYIIVILKIIELIFSKRRKIDIKERVYRKYVFSHAQMIREFNDDDRKVMETTLKNTIKNASMEKNHPKIAKKLTSKKVNFHETKNEYFEAKKDQQNNVGMSSLQAFLSRSVQKQQMQRQQEQEREEQQLELIEALFQNNQLEESDILFENQKTELPITTSSLEDSPFQPKNSSINQTEEACRQKQKDV